MSETVTTTIRQRETLTVPPVSGRSSQLRRIAKRGEFGSVVKADEVATPPEPFVTKACTCCGEAYVVTRYRAEVSRFCSVTCAGAWRTKRARGRVRSHFRREVNRLTERIETLRRQNAVLRAQVEAAAWPSTLSK